MEINVVTGTSPRRVSGIDGEHDFAAGKTRSGSGRLTYVKRKTPTRIRRSLYYASAPGEQYPQDLGRGLDCPLPQTFRGQAAQRMGQDDERIVGDSA